MSSRSDYPVTLTPKDVKEIVRCGINQAYDLIREAQAQGLFTVRKVGTTLRIPRDPFFDWWEGRSAREVPVMRIQSVQKLPFHIGAMS